MDKRYDWQSAVELANRECKGCKGFGLLDAQASDPQPCGCVLRKIFLTCYGKYVSITRSDRYNSKVSMRGGINACRPNEEYVADFTLLAHRVLASHPEVLQSTFDLHFVKGLEWTQCVRKMGATITRGKFFHYVYRVQELVGREFHEVQPFPLHPLDQYFSRDARPRRAAVIEITFSRPIPVRPPWGLQEAA